MHIWREVRNVTSQKISLETGDSASCAVVKRSFFIYQRCAKCVFVLWTSCLRVKIHYNYMWSFAKKLYHGWMSTMTSSNEISWKLPPEMKSWLRPCWPILLNKNRRYTCSEMWNLVLCLFEVFNSFPTNHQNQGKTARKAVTTNVGE